MNYPIRTDALTKTFGHTEALRGVTMEVPEGAVFALAGPNGAGKTTAIKTLLNIHHPTSGRADVLGVDSRRLGAGQFARIGYVSENQRLPGWMKAGYFFSYCKAFYPTWADADLAELVRLYDLPLDRTLNAMSKGMRVKAALASSLAYRPSLIVLDEPFGGLDVLVREEVIESLIERTPETTVLLASHDLAEIEGFATHIAYLNDGRLEFAEEIGRLSERFREVEITLESPMDWPRDLPASWLNPEQSPVAIRFTDSNFDKARSHADIQRLFPSAREVTFRTVPLRAMMVALARSAQARKGGV
jgi:ABC-2 type transport system ATP-binding protein